MTQNITRHNGPNTTSHILDLFLTNILDISTKVIRWLNDLDIVLVGTDLRPTRQRDVDLLSFFPELTDAVLQDITNYSMDYSCTDPHTRLFTSLKHTILTSMGKTTHNIKNIAKQTYTSLVLQTCADAMKKKKNNDYRHAQTYNTPGNCIAFKPFQKIFPKPTKLNTTIFPPRIRNNFL